MFEELPFWDTALEVMDIISPPRPPRPVPAHRPESTPETEVVIGGLQVFESTTEAEITETRVPACSRAQKQTMLCSLEYSGLSNLQIRNKFVRDNFPGLCYQN